MSTVLDQASFSRLEKYGKCSYLYWLHYWKPIPRPVTDTVATVAGTVAHSVLEQFYDNELVNRSISTLDLLNHYWEERLKAEGLETCFVELQYIALQMSELHARATEGYKGPDPILTKDRKFSKTYKKTTDWANALKALGIDKRSADINEVAGRRHKLWGTVSLADVFSESYVFLKDYRDTMGFLTMYKLEMPISRDDDQNSVNTVYWPGTRIEFTGFLDVIATDSQGRLYIIDHKTSKDKPDENKVTHWEQLILYGWALHQLWGRYPDYIGINHLRSNSLVVAKYDPALIEGALNRALGKMRGVLGELFYQANPTDYNNPCYSEYSPENACPYLFHCHPRFFEAVRYKIEGRG